MFETRKDFPMLSKTMAGKPLIYFDNSATALTPNVVIDEIVNYYSNLNTNSHRGDYELSHELDSKFDAVRGVVANFLNCNSNEIVYTSGTTESINLVSKSFFLNKLKAGDEIIINYAEHASNVLPWFELKNLIDVKVVFAPLENGILTLEGVKSVITEKTKLIALAHVTNTFADTRDVKAICEYANENNIYTVIDGAQSVPHKKVDVKDINCDFYAFSAHKMYGPTGIGVLFGKSELLDEMSPYNLGGGMNGRFDKNVCYTLKNSPTKFEAGTINIAGVLGMGAAINYINQVDIDKIYEYEKELKSYAVSKMKELENLVVYNDFTENSVIIFNVYDGDTMVFPQDVACYLNEFGIAIRAGDHCAKLLDNVIDTRVTCRASFSFYNTKEEIDVFVDALKECTLQTSLQI